MAGIQTRYGKAFEYACLKAFFEALHTHEMVTICENPQLRTALRSFEGISGHMQDDMMMAAKAAVRVLLRLEPQLENALGNDPLYIAIQADRQGQLGDVRDILCIRRQNQWEIGLSCKHNHHAVKHSRLSDTIDFGQDWFGTPCSAQYFAEVVPRFNVLRAMREDAKTRNVLSLWKDIPDKQTSYYRPVLQSFLDELCRLLKRDPEIPGKLIRYLLGRYDFYKVITDDRHRTTRVAAVNLSGSMNRAAGEMKSIVDIPRLRLPTRFYHIGFKENSSNTIEIVCDEGWAISLRIHNAKEEVEPSLKFDVQLISLPNSIHAQVEAW